jgi:hypothetical protein
VAKPRILWSALKPATKKRKLSYYKKQGLTPGQVASRYNAGTLGPQAASRGHAKTPERPERAAKHPEKYPEYVRKRAKTGGGGSPGPGIRKDNEALAPRIWLDKAYLNIDLRLGPGRPLGQLPKYNPVTVRANVYGGITAESGPVPGMNLATAKWTAKASEDELIEFAWPQYRANPWWYH